jgi:WD40 repeat protein
VGDDPVRLLRAVPGGASFLAASGSLLALFERDTGRRLAEYRGHADDLTCLELSPDGKVLATGAEDRSVRLWELSSGACRMVLRDWLPTAFETENAVFDVLFHPDGEGLLTCSEDGVVRDYRLPQGELVGSDGPSARIGRARWLEGGRRAVMMTQWAPSLVMLSMASFERSLLQPPAVGRMLSMDVSRDGTLMLAAATDGTTLLWSTADGSPWASVEGHGGPVLFAAFTPDGSGFLTASADGTARVWPTDPAAAARERQPEVIPFGGP